MFIGAFSKVFGLNKLSLYFILGFFGLIAFIVLYNADAVLSRFGFETTSTLKAKVAKLEEQNRQLTEINEQLNNDLNIVKERNKLELEAMKKYYEYKLYQYKKTDVAKKELEKKNIELIKELEEQRKKIASNCNLDEKSYYLYSTKTYDSASSNNYDALVTYQGLTSRSLK